MPKVDITEAVMYNGVMYGPGQGVQVPDDKALQERIEYFNQEAKIRNEAALAGGLAMLPAGHPYTQMYPVVNNQPPEFEGEAVSPSAAMLSVQASTPVQYAPDGATVGGTEDQDTEPFQPGYQSLSVVDPATATPKELSELNDLTPPTGESEEPQPQQPSPTQQQQPQQSQPKPAAQPTQQQPKPAEQKPGS